jgi:NADPH2:quinone reductase
MMWKQVVERHGPPEAMTMHNEALPAPGPAQLRVVVERVGVALSDVLMREGRYPGGPVPPYTPGWDVVGVVDAVGRGVHPRALGMRVAALVFRGGYATHALVDERLAAPVPADLSSDAAACLILNYATAWRMITGVACGREGERLLVRGAGGGVGTAALDIARLLGMSAWGAASPAKTRTVERLGATWIADERLEVAAEAVGGFDIVLDPLGGRETWRAMRLLKPHGRVVSYGFTALPEALQPLRVGMHLGMMRLRTLAARDRSARFFRLSKYVAAEPAGYRNDLAELLQHASAGRLTPLVDEVLPLRAAPEAHRRLQASAVTGKLLLDPKS